MFNVSEKHEKMLYPMTRVRTDKAGGSGTIIYSKPEPGKVEKYETYVLSNFHVIDDAVEQKKQWSTLLQRDVKKDIFKEVTVEQFDFEYESWEPTTRGYRGVIKAYDKLRDIALIKVKSTKKFPYVAELFPKGKEEERLRSFMPVYVVGCGLGHSPFQTSGELAGFSDEIDNYPYWLTTAPTIFGNSGGALYLMDTAEFIGMPSRIAVTGLFGSSPITHMSWSVPVTSIYDFLEENIFQFIYDNEFDSKKCAEMRKNKRERDEGTQKKDEDREDSGVINNPDLMN